MVSAPGVAASPTCRRRSKPAARPPLARVASVHARPSPTELEVREAANRRPAHGSPHILTAPPTPLCGREAAFAVFPLLRARAGAARPRHAGACPLTRQPERLCTLASASTPSCAPGAAARRLRGSRLPPAAVVVMGSLRRADGQHHCHTCARVAPLRLCAPVFAKGQRRAGRPPIKVELHAGPSLRRQRVTAHPPCWRPCTPALPLLRRCRRRASSPSVPPARTLGAIARASRRRNRRRPGRRRRRRRRHRRRPPPPPETVDEVEPFGTLRPRYCRSRTRRRALRS